jgi:hypothetical protein
MLGLGQGGRSLITVTISRDLSQVLTLSLVDRIRWLSYKNLISLVASRSTLWINDVALDWLPSHPMISFSLPASLYRIVCQELSCYIGMEVKNGQDP